MATVAITGATGHLGANLVRQLVARGDEVRALVRRPRPPELHGLALTEVRGDVISGEGLDELLDGAELLYHLAAQISIVGPMNGLVEAVNVEGVRQVTRAALRSRVRRMIHTCSVHAFSHSPWDRPVDETRPRVGPGQAPAYDVSKARGEALVRQAIEEGLDAVIVHPSAVIGPYDYRPSRLGLVLLKLYRRRLPALLSGGYDFVDARDVAATMIAAVDKGRTGESYLTTGRYLTLPQLSAAAERITGVSRPRLTAPAWLAQLGAPVMDVAARFLEGEPLYTSESLIPLRLRYAFDSSKAQRELGHTIRPTEDTLRDIYAWHLAAGTIAPKTDRARALADLAVSPG
ncbi:MAG: NAD-dependent epimerase/dehydratase family protein [Myxococcales bacterium]|nr:NAD-dependent epimerase/dehydratase family protein [Myxococcales bacterium]MCB9714447.1 NAD-dependent epimerase/dehydratase family protein [Myxococcales bacterium]